MQYGVTLDDFMSCLDPLKPIQYIKHLHSNRMLRGTGIKQAPFQCIVSSWMLSLATHWIADVAIFTSHVSEGSPVVPTSSELIKNTHLQNLYQLSWLEYSAFICQRYHELPIVLDTGASMSLTPVPSDFNGNFYPASISEVSYLAHTTRIFGKGTIEQNIIDYWNVVRVIRTTVYCVPNASIDLFIIQTYF